MQTITKSFPEKFNYIKSIKSNDKLIINKNYKEQPQKSILVKKINK